MYVSEGAAEKRETAPVAPPRIVMTLPTNLGPDDRREFIFHGYGDPAEVYRTYEPGYALKVRDDDGKDAPGAVWYLNANGYAQKLNPSRLPYKKPCGCATRLLLIPNFPEE